MGEFTNNPLVRRHLEGGSRRAFGLHPVRFKDFKGIHCNAQMTERMIHQFAEPDEHSLQLLRRGMERLKLSARAYNRILKVARTIADLEASERVQSHHIAEATVSDFLHFVLHILCNTFCVIK